MRASCVPQRRCEICDGLYAATRKKRNSKRFSLTSRLKQNRGSKTIIGVVRNFMNRGLALPPAPQLFSLFRQLPERSKDNVVRTATNPESMAPAVARELKALDADIPLGEIRSMETHMSSQTADTRFATLLLGLFCRAGDSSRGDWGLRRRRLSGRATDSGVRSAARSRRRLDGHTVARVAIRALHWSGWGGTRSCRCDGGAPVFGGLPLWSLAVRVNKRCGWHLSEFNCAFMSGSCSKASHSHETLYFDRNHRRLRTHRGLCAEHCETGSQECRKRDEERHQGCR